ncbi:hypothetical protein [Actinoallomurus sp. NPDC050550]|uniref:hypothetical protein n=1 Tax=Actinoallomurus sp. NPDC050550 TaxID=3154937 RepID=UPI0033D6BC48
MLPEESAAFLDMLCPDQPLGFLAEPVSVTPQRWGSIPRTYVSTMKDNAIAPAVQEIMVKDADDFTPENRFRWVQIASGHSPYASRPAELAGIITGIDY